MELMIVIAMIAILAVVALIALNPQTQLKKSRDAKRKNDLEKVQNKLESYFADKGNYPTISCAGEECCQELEAKDTLLAPYLDGIPADPASSRKYLYCSQPSQSQWYKIFTNIEYTQDTQLARNPCRPGCIKNSTRYNYVVSSPNILLETDVTDVPEGAVTPDPSDCAAPGFYCPPSGVNRNCCGGDDFLYCGGGLYWCAE